MRVGTRKNPHESDRPLEPHPLPPFLPPHPCSTHSSPCTVLHTAASPPTPPVPATSPPQQQPREGGGRAEGGAALAHGGHHIHTTSPPTVAVAEGKATGEVGAADSRWGGGEEEVRRSVAGAVTGGRGCRWRCRCWRSRHALFPSLSSPTATVATHGNSRESG
ncbi:unnamed protein product [Closterium sp. Naga37s-1]|nr:unnamed protein product [Closterium sp. Naga37s-1]